MNYLSLNLSLTENIKAQIAVDDFKGIGIVHCHTLNQPLHFSYGF